MASRTLVSWPSAEHMTTRACGSIAMISLRAARPSFSGMVMSRVMPSGLRAWNWSTASWPLAASPITSWPPLLRASETTFRMKTASSTTSTRAIGIISLVRGSACSCSCSWLGGGGVRVAVLVGRRRVVVKALDADGPVGAAHEHQPALRERRAVHVEVDGLVGRAVELDDRAARQGHGLGRGHPRPPELDGHAQLRLAQPVAGRAALGGGWRRRGACGGHGGIDLAGALLERELHLHDERLRDQLDQPAGLAEHRERHA